MQPTTHLTDDERDSLIIIHFKINRSVPKAHIEKLIFNNWIDKVEGGFRTTGKARDMIRKLC